MSRRRRISSEGRFVRDHRFVLVNSTHLTAVCIVPKSVILSHRTSDLTTHLPLGEDFSAADVTLHLAACLLYELLLGEESRFYPWLQILPRETVAIPTFWAEEDMYGADGVEALSRLAGTEGEKELHRKDAEGMSLVRNMVYHFNNRTISGPTITRRSLPYPPWPEQHSTTFSTPFQWSRPEAT